MKTISKLMAFVLSLGFVINVSNVNAEINYSKNEDYYEKLCSNKASYEINKQACVGFDQWKKDGNGQVEKMQKSVEDDSVKDMTLDELTALLNTNRELITEKTAAYKTKKKRIAANKAKVKKLEKEVSNALALMQVTSDENKVIDVIMGSTSLNDLLNKIDGMEAINNANLDSITKLDQTNQELVEDNKYIKSDLKTLKEIKAKQEKLLLEFQRQEADLYSGSNSGGKATYNNLVNDVDLSKINDTSSSWKLPTKSGTVSAGTWYYSGGGWHPGADFAVPVGTEILAPGDGVLLATATGANGYGNHMVAAFKKGDYVYTMIFGHMSQFKSGVSSFKKGDVIGYTGNTGNSTGPHVHVEVFRHNTSSLSTVVKEFKKTQDYWFGLGYSSKGNASTVQRLQPTEVFGVSVGSTY
ncbi:M23 family metallopeptidase [Mycoplasma sp. P36-A1]|uniref:M23 family metallopeptidase n=1 Tax=Mycoplasma sp. P36-A1 TaxID=3252900 RepID=UPI003C2C50CD